MIHYYSEEKPDNVTVEEWRQMQLVMKIASDDAFQANSIFIDKDGSHGRWLIKHREDYFESVVMGTAPSKYILVDVKKCHAAADTADRGEDIEYFQKWIDKGVDILILDAFNRNETIDLIFNDKVKLKPNDYQIYTGEFIKISEKYNVWSKLPTKMKDHINKQIISIGMYVNVVRANLSEICKRVNFGAVWNRHLFRNTAITYIANVVRLFIATNYKFFQSEKAKGCKWFNSNQLLLRYPDAFIQQMIWIDLKSWISNTKTQLNDDELDILYKENVVSESNLNASMSRVVDFFRMMGNTKDGNGGCCYYAFKNRIVILHLFHLYSEARQNGKIFISKKFKDLYKKFMDVHVELLSLQGPLEKHPEHYHKTGTTYKLYSKMITGIQYENVQKCNELITDRFDIHDFCYKPGKRVVNDDAKLIRANQQGWITPEGVAIYPSIVNTGAYEKGHGLETFASNPEKDADINDTYIQTKLANKTLGNKPIPSLENKIEAPA